MAVSVGESRRLVIGLLEAVGRPPGTRRRLPEEIEESEPLPVTAATWDDVTAWAARLGVAPAARDP